MYIATGHMGQSPLLTLAKVDWARKVTILPGIGFRIVYFDHFVGLLKRFNQGQKQSSQWRRALRP